MFACLLNPIDNRVFLVSFDPCHTTDAAPFRYEGQGIQNLTLRGPSAIEDRSFGFYKSITAGLALETLSACFGLAELDDVRLVFALVSVFRFSPFRQKGRLVL